MKTTVHRMTMSSSGTACGVQWYPGIKMNRLDRLVTCADCNRIQAERRAKAAERAAGLAQEKGPSRMWLCLGCNRKAFRPAEPGAHNPGPCICGRRSWRAAKCNATERRV